ncbi:MAG: sialidase family protein, partial [Tepidisphaeraceae bacterium]
TDFHSMMIYQSKQRPSYTSWASFFPGNKPGEWYINCVEMTTPAKPTTRASTQFVYQMALPRGYDTSKYLQELVLLKSTDAMKSWDFVTRKTVTANGGSLGGVCTGDGTLHGFVWACYSRDPKTKTSDIYQLSRDGGKTWSAGPTFVSERFAWYPQRLRTLRDGTLVLCCPRAAKWGKGTDYPVRAATKLDVVSDMEMMLFLSRDQGKTWSNALPIFSGQAVSETDFVELPDGNLLFINNSIFATPGRQIVYRDGDRFTPGPLERVQSGVVPETVCLTNDGLLIGCHRPGTYHWSDDLGQNWHPLEGASSTIEVYQPTIHHLGDGRIACAGHYGADDPIGSRDQSINLHRFTVSAPRKAVAPKLWIDRGFDEAHKRFLNSYTVSLSAGGKPLANKPIDVWYVARDTPGYDPFNAKPLEERMKLGGKRVALRTGDDGKAKLDLPEFDGVADIHASYQLVIRFNADRADPEYTSASLPQLEYYANSGLDP